MLHLEISKQCIAGSLAGAMALVKDRPATEVQEAMLRAGFSTAGMYKLPQFWQEVQTNLAKACAARKDGWGLR